MADREFDCCECGRHILSFGAQFGDLPMCAACIMMPGWFRDPRLAELLDPEHARNPPEGEK